MFEVLMAEKHYLDLMFAQKEDAVDKEQNFLKKQMSRPGEMFALQMQERNCSSVNDKTLQAHFTSIAGIENPAQNRNYPNQCL